MQYLCNNPSFGKNIRALRQAANLTQEQTAAQLQLRGFDISRSVYGHIECGLRNIHISELAALKQIFNASYDDFFIGFESP